MKTPQPVLPYCTIRQAWIFWMRAQLETRICLHYHYPGSSPANWMCFIPTWLSRILEIADYEEGGDLKRILPRYMGFVRITYLTKKIVNEGKWGGHRFHQPTLAKCQIISWKQFINFSFEPKNQQRYFCISALASKSGQIKKI